MRTITTAEICDTVAQLVIKANRILPEDVASALCQLRDNARAPLERFAAERFLANKEAAAAESLPLCQDTGSAVLFLEVGQEVHITGGLLEEAVQAGVARGYCEGYLRKSIVGALDRRNTGDNTPPILHTRIVAGDRLRLTMLPKGAGAENMSRLAMLQPADGIDGIRAFVIDTVKQAGANPCPPILVGVGIGGNFETAPLLAKKALLREIGSKNIDPDLGCLEAALLAKINALGIGVQGFGGPHTALAVFVETMPCHFASLPVAVNLNCHVARHQTAVL